MKVSFAAPDREFPEYLFVAVWHRFLESAGCTTAF